MSCHSIGQRRGDGHLPPHAQLEAGRQCCEIRKADDDLRSYPQGLFQHLVRFPHLLESLVKDDEVE